MTLGFTQQIKKKPNYFIEKIWEGLFIHRLIDEGFSYIDYYNAHLSKFGKIWDGGDGNVQDSFKPKLHTIRADPSNRWKEGNDIHMVINNRTKNRFQFAPVLKCVSVQDIVITEKIMTVYDCVKLKNGRVFTVQVDGRYLPKYRIMELAINDGFDSVEDFFNYFNGIKGRLTHWTGLSY